MCVLGSSMSHLNQTNCSQTSNLCSQQFNVTLSESSTLFTDYKYHSAEVVPQGRYGTLSHRLVDHNRVTQSRGQIPHQTFCFTPVCDACTMMSIHQAFPIYAALARLWYTCSATIREHSQSLHKCGLKLCVPCNIILQVRASPTPVARCASYLNAAPRLLIILWFHSRR